MRSTLVRAALFAAASVPSVSADGFTTQFLAIGAPPQDVATADLDGDGVADVVVAVPFAGLVSVTLSAGDGAFTPAAPVAFGGQPVAVALDDVDGDGSVDLVAVDAALGTLETARGHGDGTFTAPVASSIGTAPRALTLAHVDDDALLDAIVLRDAFTHPLCWLPGVGDGTFGAPVIPATGFGARAATTLDADDDGHVDLAVVDVETDTLRLLLGSPDGFAAPSPPIDVGAEPVAVAALDVDLDGDVDLITANTAGNDVSLLRNDGRGGFGSAASFDVGLNPTDLAIGDVTGDGLRDVVVSLGGAGSLVVLSPDGVGGIEAVATIPTGLVPLALAIDDVDGDLFDDVVSADAFANGVTVAQSTAGPWVDVGGAFAGPLGDAPLLGTGLPSPGGRVRFDAPTVPPGTPGVLVLGTRRIDQPNGPFVIVPSLDVVLPIVAGDAVSLTWPSAAVPTDEVFAQAFYGLGATVVATNALRSVVQWP